MMAPMFERFSDEARRTVVRALVEARLLGHDYVGTEHTLIALATADGMTAAALASEGVSAERARGAVADVVSTASASTSWDDGPYTARARHTFELGLREAFGLDHHFVSDAHLLLGLLRLGQGNGVQALESLGVDLAGLRRKVSAGLEDAGPPEPPPVRRSPLGTGHRLAIHGPDELDLREQPPLNGHSEVDDGEDTAETPLPPAADGHACSFCGEGLRHGDRFVAGPEARICLECVRASARLLGAMDALSQDFTIVYDGQRRTATLSLGIGSGSG
jgi:hypothetical protein